MWPRLLGRWPASAPIWQAYGGCGHRACSKADHLGVSVAPGTSTYHHVLQLNCHFQISTIFRQTYLGLLIFADRSMWVLMSMDGELEKPETACMARKGLVHGNRATGHLRLSERFEECYCHYCSLLLYNIQLCKSEAVPPKSSGHWWTLSLERKRIECGLKQEDSHFA